jgi:hypothetical protein
VVRVAPAAVRFCEVADYDTLRRRLQHNREGRHDRREQFPPDLIIFHSFHVFSFHYFSFGLNSEFSVNMKRADGQIDLAVESTMPRR